MMSRFMANRPISVSSAKPSMTSPPPIFWKSQTTSSSGKGICCFASNLTISAIFFSSTGGSLTNRARPDWPAMPMATSSLLDAVAREELLERLADEGVRVGVGLGEDLGVLDVVERGGGGLPVDQFEAQRLEGALADVDAPNAFRDDHDSVSPNAAWNLPMCARNVTSSEGARSPCDSRYHPRTGAVNELNGHVSEMLAQVSRLSAFFRIVFAFYPEGVVSRSPGSRLSHPGWGNAETRWVPQANPGWRCADPGLRDTTPSG